MAINRRKRDGTILTTYYQSNEEVMEMGDEGLMGEGMTGETCARIMTGFAADNLNSDTTYSHIPWCEHDEETDISRFAIADQDHDTLIVTVEAHEDHYERQSMWRKYLRDNPTQADPHLVRELRDERTTLSIAARKILDTIDTNLELVSSGVNYHYGRKQELAQLRQSFLDLVRDMGIQAWVTRHFKR